MTTKTHPLLAAANLSKAYARRGGEEFLALSGASFTLDAADTLGIVGESGSGKSTLGKIVAGLIAASSGEISLDGVELGARRDRVTRRHIQYVYQEPVAALDPKMSIQRIIEEPLRLYVPELSSRDREDRVVSLLEDVGLSADLRGGRPRQLSGGQAQRVVIARALAGSPQVLVCDEPTSALDSTVQAQILELMRELKEQKGFSYIFITHSFGVVKSITNRLMVMDRGRIVEQGTTERILEQPEYEYTQKLLSSVPRIDLPYYDI